MKILSVDYGDARTGIAVCDENEVLASPVDVLHIDDPQKVVDAVCALAKNLKVELIVVGNPINMNGTIGNRSVLCNQIGQAIHEDSSLPVVMWDERGTTITATHYLNMTDVRGKKRKNTIDAVAAVIILENYLSYRKNHPGEIEHGTF